MKGTILSIDHDGSENVMAVEGEPTLDPLKDAIGGGYLEAVPGFTTFEWGGEMHDCVVFVDEDGRRKELPFNVTASKLWHQALRRSGHPGLFDASGNAVDFLVGRIAVVFGDAEFMAAL